MAVSENEVTKVEREFVEGQTSVIVRWTDDEGTVSDVEVFLSTPLRKTPPGSGGQSCGAARQRGPGRPDVPCRGYLTRSFT